jgi:hypothetical protein
MSFLPLYDSLKSAGIVPKIVTQKGSKTFEFYSCVGVTIQNMKESDEIIATTDDCDFVKLRSLECLACSDRSCIDLPIFCFEIYEQNCEIASEEDGDTYRIVFSHFLGGWELFSFITPHHVQPCLTANTLEDSLKMYDIKPTVIVTQKKNGYTHYFYGNVQIEFENDTENIFAIYNNSRLQIFSNRPTVMTFNSRLSIEFNHTKKTTFNVFESDKYKLHYIMKVL